ncbi:glycine/sarcosine/betaine reductase complex component C subunit beta [Clostridium argentinense CDC 2741]|uniref:Glycine/sarcosine/betaine reductase complex component C subunit beta n=1 Tax=Clostridium argentinense CDC 2741 TaxID=1418104 RepID=A0A0C1UFE8_9CLOT|nr:glycine/sarcosine/betaine reductase complex component C subunit beta [Clostridium argentinense]ARC85756.1 glycine reductase [Clostridium argentinense]KIE46140.1 glycine/sarcosine/betaine reductase complex component C subunit beta [Clostridium argentinense CDC 2741]NFF39835.1 glycine reductase [Clostridium argentinense]NFP51062.1 glycine reductase [Clostridium argentinense]NFP73194.1 glycine reductase [Clostridium argentinense]
MNFPVLKKAAYILVNTPDMVIHNGTTQTLERETHPDSEYLKELNSHLRPYEEVMAYAPNQTYIGNITPEELGEMPRPWYGKNTLNANRFGKFGEVMPQDEFYGLMKISDVFDLVILEEEFANNIKEKLSKHPLIASKVEKVIGDSLEKIENLVNNSGAEGLYEGGKLVGCVRRAHEFDPNLSAHYMLENLAVKASGVLAGMHLVDNLDIPINEIEYIIECSEEAIGDMNQRGGGNIAKAIGEVVGLTGATGADMRGFCAGPSHSLITAASLVKSGIYKNVLVIAGGATAKLGMNGRDHVKKGIPVLEDCLGGFAVLVSQNDGISPILRTDVVGTHTIGHGASPQAVLEALVLDPLIENGIKITDVDKYAPEMQTPDITEPAGAGDVPTQNYKMIAALAVKKGQLEKKELPNFVKQHGYPGYAPTQGHIPSGAPIIGHGIEHIKNGVLNNFMIVGKGSLFLGRMTNLFDGVSILVEKNPGKIEESAGISKEEVKSMVADAMKDFAEFLAKNME